MFTHQLSILDEHHLVTDGPYAYVRHPSYTGFILYCVGTVLVCLSAGTFVNSCGIMDNILCRIIIYGGLFGLVYIALAIPSRANTEDKVLKEQFETEWKEWSKRVPYKLIPYVF
jgi:protein-S-isoprenylcysteine O-methyltransferase Ste14